jgi:flagellar hook-associated protein 1 FlgK
MSGISMLMNIGRGALLAQQKGLDVTGHNIANVNTPGYTRQALVLQSSENTSLGRVKLGYGVNADSVTQAFDRFSTKSINQKTSSLAEYETEKSTLDYVQGLFNEETENGLNKVTADFWNAWQDLSNNPAGMAERTALLEKAQNMVQQFQGIRNGLTQIKDEMNLNLRGGIEEINTLNEQIAKLNERIVETESGGTKSNDLRDQRNNLIQNLSQLTDISYLEKDNGALTVMTKSGIGLVEGNLYWTLSQQGDNIYWNNITSDVSNQLTGGKIGAWLDLRDNILPQYMANMDELAGTMIYEVNKLHYDGYTMDGSTHKYFFDNTSMGDVGYGAGWGGTSTVLAGGVYSGNADKTFTFTIDGLGGPYTVGTDIFSVDWTDGVNNGTINVTATNYENLSVRDGVRIDFGVGDLVDGDTFSISVQDNADAAKTIALSSDVADTPSNIAASQSSDPTETGNNQNALAIQALSDEQVSTKKWTYQNRGGIQSSTNQFGTMDEYYNVLVGDIGMLTDEAGQNQNFYETMINQLNDLRDSVSGVSLDEEMINMMKYQYAYIAASKLVNASDAMLQALMQMQ